jgi:sugar/nucleoside kinase (ribokinase family)
MRYIGKTFRYLTTPLQPGASDLPLNLLASRSFHLLLKPDKVITEVAQLIQLRSDQGITRRPLLVWEPFPSLCTVEHLDKHEAACRLVDVFSPNHLELLGLCGMPSEPFDARLIEECAQNLLEGGSGSHGEPSSLRAIVVRAGEKGCLVVSGEGKTWLKPYLMDPSQVVDATGGGNTFLGGFTAVLESTGDLRRAAISGSVAASFAIEQIGLPNRKEKDGKELWNGHKAHKRLEVYEI